MAVPRYDSSYICLDRSSIAPVGQTQIEPCDLLRLNNEGLQLFHIKLGTRSAMLSHLFNQAAVSVDLLLSENESRDKLKQLLEGREESSAVDCKKFSIVYGIVTHRNIDDGVKLLPLFSKISLYRVAKSLEIKRIKWSIVFIQKQNN